MLLKQLKFVDTRLQGWLLAGLVALELVMLGLAIVYLYLRYSTLIDANLFRAHAEGAPSLLGAMLAELALVILVMSVLNTLALVAAHQLWTHHVHLVLQRLRERTVYIKALDLKGAAATNPVSHRTLRSLETWRRSEQERLRAMRQALALAPSVEVSWSEAELQQLRQALSGAREALKKKPPTGAAWYRTMQSED